MEAQFTTNKLAKFIAEFKDSVVASIRRSAAGPSYLKAPHPPHQAVEPREPPLLRNAPWTLRELTVFWIDELIASNELIRRAAADVDGFIEALQLARSSQALNEDDAQMVLIVEKFQSVLSRAFAPSRTEAALNV